MAIDTQRGIPGIPLAALDAIPDQNTQMVLRAIVDGWHVRNGASGKGDNAFITQGEVATLRGAVGGLQASVTKMAVGQADNTIKPGDISRIINDLQAQVIESQLFKELGERIDTIDLNLVTEQAARVAAVKAVADGLAAEAATRLGFDTVQGSQIASLQTVNDSQASQISGLATRVSGAESTIINLQRTTATQATSLASLTTRVGTSESNITELQQTTGTQASSLTSLTTRMGSAESGIKTLNTTTASQATALSALSTRVSSTEASISSEAVTRANADNALSTSVTTQFATVNGNLSALQTKQTTTANNVATLTSSVSTLQSSVGDNTLAISAEATARVNADNAIYGKYAVKIDTNGYVSGFGLISTANNSTPVSEFIVRADRFSIASPSGPGVAPKVPFVVYTTTQYLPSGQTIPPGVYMDSAVVKQLYGAYIEGSYIKAGVLEAGKILTGSALVDSQSLDQIPFVAQSSFQMQDVGDANTAYFTHPGLVFYGPYFHNRAPFQQRVRGGLDAKPLGFSIVVNGVVDSYLSLYYRQARTLGAGNWVGIAQSSDSQDSYGAASLSRDLFLYCAYDQVIEFAIRSTRLDGYIYNPGKPSIYSLSISIRCTNQ